MAYTAGRDLPIAYILPKIREGCLYYASRDKLHRQDITNLLSRKEFLH